MSFRYLAVAGLLLLAPTPAAAQIEESCSFDEEEAEVSAVIAPGGEATLQIVEGQILFGAEPQPCGAATNINTDLISIAAHPGSSERLILDQRTGVFGPGKTPEHNIPDIDISATLEGSDSLVLYLTEGDDRIGIGQNGIGLNADGDVDVTFPSSDPDPRPRFPIEIHALGGNDYVNGRGEFGAGLAYLGPLVIHGGPGDDELLRGSFEADVITGGPGDDVLDGQDGDDVLNGGPGNDTLTAGGGDDQLIGGPGVDSLIGSTGDDVIFAIDLEADTLINGGPGMDTAYYDAEGLDPDPLFVENEIPGDTTPPDISCEPADGVWHAEDVAIACTAEDPESLLPDPGDAAFELSTNVPVGSETADAATGTREVCNGAGLCSTAGPVTGNRVDKRAPANPTGVESTDHTLGKWSRDREVSIVFDAASDAGSGVDGLSYSWTIVATSDADQSKDLEETALGLTSPMLENGRWYLHIATVDNVGNWSLSDHYGPYLIDGALPRVSVLPASVRVGKPMRLRYRTADNNRRTRERITLARGGSIVAAWTRPMAVAQWSAIQSVPWTPRRSGPYSYCVQAWDQAGNTRRACRIIR